MADLLTGLTDDDITTTGAQGTRMAADADSTDAPSSDGTDTGDTTDATDQGDTTDRAGGGDRTDTTDR